jgi:hypothetical protein
MKNINNKNINGHYHGYILYKMNKDINNKNINGHYHGYNEWYYNHHKIGLRTIFKHGQHIGYTERHLPKETRYYIR